MGLPFGIFCSLAKLDPGPDVFAFWLTSHSLRYTLQDRIVAKLVADY